MANGQCHLGRISPVGFQGVTNQSLALDAVGGSGSPAGSALWYVAGLQMSIRDWSLRDGWYGKRVEKNEAKGILVAALGVLARYYGYERAPRPRRERSTHV